MVKKWWLGSLLHYIQQYLYNSRIIFIHPIILGYMVAQLVEALSYKLEGVMGSNPDGVTGIFH